MKILRYGAMSAFINFWKDKIMVFLNRSELGGGIPGTVECRGMVR